VIDISRKVTQQTEAFVQNDKSSAKQLFNEIQSLGDEVDDTKRAVAQELAEIGAILIHREDFLRFTNVTSEVADLSKGVAFRILEMMQQEWDVPSDLKKSTADLAGAVFEAVSRLRETFLTLNYGSPKVLEKARDVGTAERAVDNLYRELVIDILQSNLKLPVLLLMRDITQLLEDAADKVEDASDAARILAFAL